MNFWDTSAIVPLCVHEPTSADVRDLLMRDQEVAVWWGTRTECLSALARRLREGGLTLPDKHAAHDVLRTLAETWTEILPGDAVRNTAERLLAVHSIRTADAFQLAAALLRCQGEAADRGFVTFDLRLCDAGYREGFHILPDTH